MSEGWYGQDAVWLGAVPPDVIPRMKLSADVQAAAFADGALTRMWPAGVRPAGSALERAEICLLTRPAPRKMYFAVPDALPCAFPGRETPLSLGLNACVTVRPGAFSALYRLWEQAEKPDGLTLRRAYMAALHTEMEEIWRAAAGRVCGGEPLPRIEWLNRAEHLAAEARDGMTALLMRSGLLCTEPCSICGIAPVSVPAKEKPAQPNKT